MRHLVANLCINQNFFLYPIDAAYYGFRDDDDGLLVPLEVEAEKAAIDAAVKEWKEKREAGKPFLIAVSHFWLPGIG